MHSKVVQGLSLYYSIYSAPCRSVLLTLKYLNVQLPLDGMREMNIHEQEHLQPWFEKINYQKTIPTIADNNFILWESQVITKYLVQKYGSNDQRQLLYPDDLRKQNLIDRLLYFDRGVLYPSIADYFNVQTNFNEIPNPVLGAEVERSLQLLQQMLLKGNFALGGIGESDQLTIADFNILASLSYLESMDYSYERYSEIYNYVEFLKDYLKHYRDCFYEGITLMKSWARLNLKYLPNYVDYTPSVIYEEHNFIAPEHRI